MNLTELTQAAAQIVELEKAATPGEWLVEADNCHAGQVAAFHGDEPGHYYEVWSRGWVERNPQHTNADLVAALRNHALPLSAAAQALGVAIAGLNKEVERDHALAEIRKILSDAGIEM